MIVSSQVDFNLVETTSRAKQEVEQMPNDFDIDLGICIIWVLLYITIFGAYDLIIGMYWLESHEAILNWNLKNIDFNGFVEFMLRLFSVKLFILLIIIIR